MPREGVCAGANPVGHPIFDGPKVAGYRTTQGWLLTVREPPDESPVLRVRVPFAKPRNCVRATRENEKMRVRFPSRNIEAASCPSFTIFDGSQDWVIAS